MGDLFLSDGTFETQTPEPDLYFWKLRRDYGLPD